MIPSFVSTLIKDYMSLQPRRVMSIPRAGEVLAWQWDMTGKTIVVFSWDASVFPIFWRWLYIYIYIHNLATSICNLAKSDIFYEMYSKRFKVFEICASLSACAMYLMEHLIFAHDFLEVEHRQLTTRAMKCVESRTFRASIVYPVIIKHGSGKSPINTAFHRKTSYKCSIFQHAMFDDTGGYLKLRITTDWWSHPLWRIFVS